MMIFDMPIKIGEVAMRTEESLEKKVKEWEKECDHDEEWETISEIKTLDVVLETNDFTTDVSGFVVLGTLKPECRSGSEGDGDTGLVTNIGTFPITLTDIFPVPGDATIKPEWFIDGSELGQTIQAGRKEKTGGKENNKKSGKPLGAPPVLSRERVTVSLLLGAFPTDKNG